MEMTVREDDGGVREIQALPTERLEREIGELAAHIHAATCRWLLLVAELDRREGWAEWGCRSCADWLSLRCGVALGAAREQVRVARRLGQLSLVREAFAVGRLSYSKVRAISRVTSEGCEAELLDLALHATAAQLERIVRSYRGAAAADVDTANGAHERRHLSWSWDDDGSLVISGRLAAEDGALLLHALEAARDQLRRSDPAHVSAETSESEEETDRDEPGRSNADALVAVADASLAVRAATRSGGDRYQVVIHTEVAALGEDSPTGHSELQNGPALCADTARRLACDASLVSIVERNGRPLSVGRKTRTIPPALRRALGSRDGGCRFPGCNQRRWVDAHHIHHWAHGGETELSNLVLLCRHHHRLLHEGGYRLERMRDGALSFRRPDGRRIEPGARRIRGDRHEIPRRHLREGLRIRPDTPVALSGGGRFSLDLAVEGLLARDGAGLGVSAETNPESVRGPAYLDAGARDHVVAP